MIEALLWLRFTLWKRRFFLEKQWGRLAASLVALLLGGLLSFGLCTLIFESGETLREEHGSLQARGGPLAVFATWLTMALAGRVWMSLIQLGQAASFLDPRRFKIYPVPASVVSAMNFAALFFDPIWLVLYPVIATISVVIAGLPGAPPAWALLCASLLGIWATVGVLHLAAAVGAVFDARPLLRRGFAVALLILGFGVFQLSIARPGRPGLAALFAGHHWQVIAWTPPGWCAVLAQALGQRSLAHALTPFLLLLLVGLLCGVSAHQLSLREILRPAESHQISARSARGSGWRLPLVSPSFSAIFEKEAKTVIRIGWLQLVLVPVAYLLLVRTMFSGPQPLLIAAVYAQLGVLDIATNAFGRDVAAARGYFLWPVSRRELLAAKNTVAYCFSVAIFALLATVAWFSSRVTPSQVAIGFLAHAAIFPLLATYGNISSAYFPTPVRGARLRRVRGAGPIGARFFAMAMLAGAAWAPYWIAQVLGLRLGAAYLGELITMAVVYGGLLSFGAHMLEARRETLLAALARDE